MDGKIMQEFIFKNCTVWLWTEWKLLRIDFWLLWT